MSDVNEKFPNGGNVITTHNDWVQKLRREASDRARSMPTETSAIKAMMAAYVRLTELGWASAIYCPKDGTPFFAIEAGCGAAGICHYDGDWPSGTWWMHDGLESYPSRPILWRAIGDVSDPECVATVG
jgi:hypothetical protein